MAKSTSKKKSASKKKTAAAKKSAKVKKSAVKAKKAKKTAGTANKKATSKKTTAKSLVLKQFGDWKPEKPFDPGKDEAYLKAFTAPPMVDMDDKSETKRVQELLLKKIDLSEAPKKASKPKATKKKAAPKKAAKTTKKVAPKAKAKKKATVGELLKKQFESWTPKKPYVPATIDEANYTAPPFSEDKACTDLLALSFDFASFNHVEPKKPLTRAELLALTFDSRSPEKMYKPAPIQEGEYTSPPFLDDNIDGALLSLSFDYASLKHVEPKKPLTVPELLALTFDSWAPEKPFVAPPADKADFTAPPFGDGKNYENLLSLSFDYASFKLVEPREPLTIPELLELKFEAWSPEKLFVPEVDKAFADNYTAPPFVDPSDDDEATRVKELISLAFDYNSFEYVEPKEPEILSPGPINTEPQTEKEGADPMEKMTKYAIGGLILLFVLISMASFINVCKYQIKPSKTGMEIWQGNFAPMGEDLLIALPGVKPPKKIKEVYQRQEVFPYAFNFYIKKADILLHANGIPDFKKIRENLNNALAYGIGIEDRSKAYERIKTLAEIKTRLEKNKQELIKKKGIKALQPAKK